MKLLLNALFKFIAGIILIYLILFLPAGTFAYPNAWLFMALLFIPMIIVFRIRNEEKVLEQGLDGYTEYKEKVKYRLIPFIW